MAKHKIEDQNINQSLYYQLHLLNENLEYHLLGNHLLENGFALLIGAYYFQDQKLYSQAKKILIPELEEQILSDGAHFELSPMYHQLMLFRVLDSYNLIQNNSFFDQELLGLFKEKASKMLSWLRQMTFSDGSIALLNDSARKIASTTKQLESYAQNLSVPKVDLPLKESGYRRVNNGRYEIILDIGQIGPDYIPGHAHSDTLNFELYINGKPFIVDTGTSTYEKNARRTLERSTASHNVVQVENLEQSEVWGGFRVGRRASATIIEESNSFITASHNGFKKNGIIHKRSFFFEENVLTIEDEVLSLNTKNVTSNALLHFYPSISLDFHGETIETSLASITFASRNYTIIKEDVYDYAPEFNKRISAKKVSVKFQSKLTTVIQL
ncbi:MAG: alginate lyase family protein [Bacteroidota bacterium]